MKFYVKNRFVLDGVTKQPGEVIDILSDVIDKLSRANVLGEPLKETKIETAVLKPVENAMIKRKVKK
jgi:hypothetical protein